MVVHMNDCSYVKILTIKKSKKSDRQELQFLAILQANYKQKAIHICATCTIAGNLKNEQKEL